MMMMTSFTHARLSGVLVACSLLVPFLLTLGASGQQAGKIDVLKIGTSGSLALDAEPGKEEAALDTLKSFIKSETGFANEIIKYKDWRELAAKLAAGEANVGVFQGHEYAWASGQNAKLRPLALAVNVHTYRTAHVIVRDDNKATDFAGLAGQTLALPRVGQTHLELFVQRQAQAMGKELTTFFAKITTPDNVEDAVDDVVDGVVQAAVVDRVGLEAYKRRKPGRFKRLKQAAASPVFPPPL